MKQLKKKLVLTNLRKKKKRRFYHLLEMQVLVLEQKRLTKLLIVNQIIKQEQMMEVNIELVTAYKRRSNQQQFLIVFRQLLDLNNLRKSFKVVMIFMKRVLRNTGRESLKNLMMLNQWMMTLNQKLLILVAKVKKWWLLQPHCRKDYPNGRITMTCSITWLNWTQCKQSSQLSLAWLHMILLELFLLPKKMILHTISDSFAWSHKN